MWETVLNKMLSHMIRSGGLRITMPDGTTRSYGDATDPQVGVRIKDADTVRALCLQPDLALGEAYMDATITIEGDDLDGLLRLLVRNYRDEVMPLWVRASARARYLLRNRLQRINPRRAHRNAAHHYDISDDLYRLFLDEDMQYSCAYFTDPGMTLEQAQAAKKALIAAKLRLQPGMRVLDIGCGWGGMAMTLARDHGVRVTGVTLSRNQLATARDRAARAGLSDRVEFRLQDYRYLREPYDRIVSVGMLEHVGPPHYDAYFAKLGELLAPGGIALIHTIARLDPPTVQSEWLDKYIFPGGYSPPLSMLAGPVERSGLWTTDIEVLRLHYAMTLRHWLTRFNDNLDLVRRDFDARFVRMWTYYLTACIVAFEEQRQGVLQIQLAREADAVPLTRDYLAGAGMPLSDRQAAE